MTLSDEFSLEVATTVQFCRKKSGLSQGELAQIAGIGKTVVFDIEHGKKSVRLDTLLKVFNVLNIKIFLKPPLPLLSNERALEGKKEF